MIFLYFGKRWNIRYLTIISLDILLNSSFTVIFPFDVTQHLCIWKDVVKYFEKDVVGGISGASNDIA
jgi:hypothetical protein